MFKSFKYHPPTVRAEDPNNHRLGQKIRQVESLAALEKAAKPGDTVLIGYPDDRGVQRNHGRIGACEGPDGFRKVFFNYSSMILDGKKRQLFDLGDHDSWSHQLLESQEAARGTIQSLRKLGLRCISIGGGHDWAYSDFIDFPGTIINLDAHFDVRPTPEDSLSQGHSGNAFRRLQLAEARGQSQLIVVGAQKCSNSAEHHSWLSKHRGAVFFYDDLSLDIEKQWNEIRNFIDLHHKSERLALSIDLDVFSQAYAPGVSAPVATGMNPAVAREVIRHYGPRIEHLGIYELNPRLDRDYATSRLAAHLALSYLDQTL
ncbi:MAG TPA: formimidoylglutamase [Bdellovibrionota bacterium]|nr:formimidoylglutamase [Bdellovibrionota bacterium]